MLFDIAYRLGRTVAEIENEMSAQEFDEWLEYFGVIEPKRIEKANRCQ